MALLLPETLHNHSGSRQSMFASPSTDSGSESASVRRGVGC